MNDPALLELLRRELPALVRQAVRAELHRPPLATGPQRRLRDSLKAEFGDGPFASREVLAVARSPLASHNALRAALAEMQLRTAEDVGRALRKLPGVIRCKDERGAGVWAVEGLDPS